ncbi:MAG: CotH kinase family protein [Ignavibacterium sp.]|jgi:hypothetical protein|nr:CotH kinase family protein [Ignavibacterium sp.]
MAIFLRLLKVQFSILLLIFFSNQVLGQSDESWKLYDDTQVARVDIIIDPAALEWLYQNVESDSEFVASLHFQNKYINENVENIGFRLRGNTSRHAYKKSFKVSFNTFVQGREFYGVDKLNLNGEHNDPSIIRSKLSFDHYQTIGMKASRANHAEVYINGIYYGLYISVEHIDDEFLFKNFEDDTGNLWKCLYPADLNFLGEDPNIYKNLISNGRPVYELKTNEDVGDFSKLSKFISVLNNTPTTSLADSIESLIEVPEVLKYFAVNILVGEWDDYWSLMNNYYLYHEPSKDIFHFIPYDYDNTFGIDWSGTNWTDVDPYNYPKVVNGYRPLAQKFMLVPQYRNLYTHFLEFYRENVFLLSRWENRLDSLKNMIAGSVIADSFRTLDYGFDTNDFFNSYSSSGYSNQHVKFGIKQFVNLKNSLLPGWLNYQNAKPIVYYIDYEPKYPGANDSINVVVSAFDNEGLNEVLIYYQDDDSTSVQIFPMSYNPISNTKKVEESDRWIGTIPPIGAGNSGNFFIYVKDNGNQFQVYPRKKAIEIRTQQNVSGNLFINELMADNSTTIPDPNGEYDDWIEIYNSSSSPIELTGKYLTDKKSNLTKYKFTQPDLFINPNEYLLIWCDEQQSQQGIHTNFKLSKDGEFVALINNDGISIIDSITFGEQTKDISFGRQIDSGSNWVFMTPTPGSTNNPTSVDDDDVVLTEFYLNAYPNPFNPSTSIQYAIASKQFVQLKIYDVLGNEIATLVNDEKPAGSYKVNWNGSNSSGIHLSSGVYIARLSFNAQFKSMKLMLLK